MKLLYGLIIGFIIGVLATIGGLQLMTGQLPSLPGHPPTASTPAAPAAPASPAPAAPVSGGEAPSGTPSDGSGNAGAPPKTTP